MTGPLTEPFLVVVEPLAAAWLHREAVEKMRQHGTMLAALEGTQGAELGRQLLRTAARLEASMQWRKAHEAAAPAACEEGIRWLSTAEAAEVLEVGQREVVNYMVLGEGPLPASRRTPGSPWRIRADDLDDFRLRLSEVPA